MTIMDMLGQSGILTFLGMAVVFSFLWIMIICVNLTGKIFQRYNPKKDGAENKAAVPDGSMPPGLIAAISAAVSEYQRN